MITDDEWAIKRQAMIEIQLKGRGLHSSEVLEAMGKVQRHLFVPLSLRESAYEDFPLPIGESQTISQPYIVALMTEKLELKKTDRVLEIGTGSGYQTAILAELAKEVYTIEYVQGHFENAQKILEQINYKNIFFKQGDGHEGWKEYAPFDAIIGTCAPEKLPEKLLEQLSPEGRLIIPVGIRGFQNLIVIKKTEHGYERKEILPVLFVPMVHSRVD